MERINYIHKYTTLFVPWKITPLRSRGFYVEDVIGQAFFGHDASSLIEFDIQVWFWIDRLHGVI